MPLHQQRARNSIPPRRRRDRSRYPQTFQHNSELLVVRPAAAPTSLNDLEPFNMSTVLIDVHKDCYKSISQAQQGGRHRRKTKSLAFLASMSLQKSWQLQTNPKPGQLTMLRS